MAQIGLSLAVIRSRTVRRSPFHAGATTVIAPPFLQFLYASKRRRGEEIGPPDAGGIIASEDLQDWVSSWLLLT